MASPEDAESALREAAAARVSRLPMGFSVGATQRIDALIRTAADEVAQAGPGGVPDPLNTAQQRLQTLIFDAAYRQYPGGTPRREGKSARRDYDPVQPDDVDAALRGLCPGFWPLC